MNLPASWWILSTAMHQRPKKTYQNRCALLNKTRLAMKWRASPGSDLCRELLRSCKHRQPTAAILCAYSHSHELPLPLSVLSLTTTATSTIVTVSAVRFLFVSCRLVPPRRLTCLLQLPGSIEQVLLSAHLKVRRSEC